MTRIYEDLHVHLSGVAAPGQQQHTLMAFAKEYGI